MHLISTLLDRLVETRERTERICSPLETEDFVVQPIEEVSPPKWHLGHTTWFFEEFILVPHKPGYRVFNDDFSFVFNSYYETVGKRILRTDRGNLSRPSVSYIYEYRHYVTRHLQEFFNTEKDKSLQYLLEIGINHEQQHQELLLTDIKYILGNNPLLPAYLPDPPEEYPEVLQVDDWNPYPRGIYQIGHQGEGFCFDNELGRHEVLLQDFELKTELETNQSMLNFIADGGYNSFNLWHAEGWEWVRQHGISAPLYWHELNGQWHYTHSVDWRLSILPHPWHTSPITKRSPWPSGRDAASLQSLNGRPPRPPSTGVSGGNGLKARTSLTRGIKGPPVHSGNTTVNSWLIRKS